MTEEISDIGKEFRFPIRLVQLVTATNVSKGYSDGTAQIANLAILFEANHPLLSGPQTYVLRSTLGFWNNGDHQRNHFGTKVTFINEGPSEIVLQYNGQSFNSSWETREVFLRRDIMFKL